MADLAPLRALRYATADLASVVAPPYDVIGPADRAALAARSPHNVVHLDLPDGEGDARYANAAALLERFRAEGVLRLDDAPSLLRYEQTFTPPGAGPEARVTRRGFFALVRAEPYGTGAVLPHERTLSGPKEDRYKLVRATGTALSPVFMLYDDAGGVVARALEPALEVARFETPDGVAHRLARVTDRGAIASVVDALRDTPLLIADGHHRYETAVRVAQEIDAERAARGEPPAGPRASHRYLLAFLADGGDPGLVVFPTHRLVHSLEGFDRAAFLAAAGELFDVAAEPLGDLGAALEALRGAARPAFLAVFADGDAARLTVRHDVALGTHPALAGVPPVLRDADVAILHAVVIERLLGVTREAQAAQTHLRYVKVAAEGVEAVRRGEGDVLFLMNATPVEAVRRACLAGEVMPQKSTFFHPKVPTGLVFHVLDPTREV